MSTIIYPSPIFGPVHSRRLGLSLGINLMPNDGKICTFDCVYCECGFNGTHRPRQRAIIGDTLLLRDELAPSAKVSVLSNSTMLHKEDVRAALSRIDNNILKLDTVDMDYIRQVDRPTGAYDVERIIGWMEQFHGHVVVQTMFMTGSTHGFDVDNTGDAYVRPWIAALLRIRPREVMIYTIDRETPDHDLRKAPREVLDRICQEVEAAGIKCSASY